MIEDTLKWKFGIAFIHGINMFSNNRVTRKEILDIFKSVENENVKIIDIVKCDNIIFIKRRIHYATVGKLFEGVLSKHFKKKIYVTTRSMKTIDKCVKKFSISKKKIKDVKN